MIKQQAGALGLQCNDAAAEAIVKLEPELLAEKITTVAELQAALNLNHGDRLTATLVRKLIKEKMQSAHDAALPSVKRPRLEMSSQVCAPLAHVPLASPCFSHHHPSPRVHRSTILS